MFDLTTVSSLVLLVALVVVWNFPYGGNKEAV